MKESQVIAIKSVVLIIYIFLAIGLETVYRKPLFEKSLEWEKTWQDNQGDSKSMEKFFDVITEFGSQGVFIPLLLFLFLFFPLHKAYIFISVMIYSVYFDNILKMIYGNPRPFWIDPTLHIACDGGFGNPSGHSFSSMGVYLAFWHIITDYKVFKDRWYLRVFILILFLLLIIAILLSRVFLGVHSVNQILYGGSLGFAIYYFHFHIVSGHQVNAKDFFEFFRNKQWILIFTLKYVLFVSLSLLIYYLVEHDTSTYQETLSALCPDLKPYRRFNDDGFYNSLTLFVLIGCHYGLIFLSYMTYEKYPNKEEEINDWYKVSFVKQIYRILLVILFILPIILNFVLPSSMSLAAIFICKQIIPYVVALFNIFGPCIYLGIHFKVCNANIYANNTGNSILGSQKSEDNRDKVEIV